VVRGFKSHPLRHDGPVVIRRPVARPATEAVTIYPARPEIPYLASARPGDRATSNVAFV
jgi:hypothetical protein